MHHCFRIFMLLTVAISGSVSSYAETALRKAPVALDPNLPYYRPIEKLSGEIKLGGSNTLSHIAMGWIDSFSQYYPAVNISIDVNGSRQAVEDVGAGKTTSASSAVPSAATRLRPSANSLAMAQPFSRPVGSEPASLFTKTTLSKASRLPHSMPFTLTNAAAASAPPAARGDNSV